VAAAVPRGDAVLTRRAFGDGSVADTGKGVVLGEDADDGESGNRSGVSGPTGGPGNGRCRGRVIPQGTTSHPGEAEVYKFRYVLRDARPLRAKHR